MNTNENKPIRPAASLLIVRDAAEGVEVVTMKRASSMRFLPGYLAFPGGTLQEDDWQLARASTVGMVIAAQHVEDAAFAVAALRETAEEVGWLPAMVGQAGEPLHNRLSAENQQALLCSDHTIGDILSLANGQLNLKKLRFVGRWVTPAHMSARFDTRFFIVDGTRFGDELTVSESENMWARWSRPAELLAAIQAGSELAVPPTLAILAALAGAKDVNWCLRSLFVPGPSHEPIVFCKS